MTLTAPTLSTPTQPLFFKLKIFEKKIPQKYIQHLIVCHDGIKIINLWWPRPCTRGLRMNEWQSFRGTMVRGTTPQSTCVAIVRLQRETIWATNWQWGSQSPPPACCYDRAAISQHKGAQTLHPTHLASPRCATCPSAHTSLLNSTATLVTDLLY